MMDKDQDYAWMIVGAGCLVMLVGSSSYSTDGLLFEDVNIGDSYHTWILNTMYNLFTLSGFFAVILSGVYTHRKIAMLGCFAASFGYLMAASTLEHKIWLFLAFAGFIGIGIGLAVHVTFLLVISNFEKYKGLANGVLQMFAGIGYLIAPYLYNLLPSQEDRFHIKALVTVVAFLGAILFITPQSWQIYSQPPNTSSRGMNGSSSRRNSNRREVIPLMDLEMEDREISDLEMDVIGRPRRRSQYLLAVSAAILPNIPEEPEGPSTTATGTCTPVSSASTNNLFSCKNSDLPYTAVTLGTNCEQSVSEVLNQENVIIESELFNQYNSKSFASRSNNTEIEPSEQKVRRFANNQSLNTMNNQVNELNGDDGTLEILPLRTKILKSFASLEINYLKNIEFMTMALGCSLALLTSPSVPIVLYAYLSSIYMTEYQGEGETALIIIFSFDVISRLMASYVSDFSWLRRRTAFFIGNIFGSVIIAGLGFTSNSRVIYFLCVIYGVCQGILIANESIMFIDVFGLTAFPTTYGFYKCFQVAINIFTTIFLRSPTAAYTYAIHPLTPISNEKYRNPVNSTFSSDPLGLFQYDQMNMKTSFKPLFLLLAGPGVITAVIWTTANIMHWCWHKNHSHRTLQNQTILPSLDDDVL